MEPLLFFTAMQALAAFLQIWQGERNRPKAIRAYDDAMATAGRDPAMIVRAQALASLLQRDPVLNLMFSNRVARCKDNFEARFRIVPEAELRAVSDAYKKCTCLVIDAIRAAQNGCLEPPLSDLWLELGCPIVLKA
jgi:hypothetical protein